MQIRVKRGDVTEKIDDHCFNFRFIFWDKYRLRSVDDSIFSKNKSVNHTQPLGGDRQHARRRRCIERDIIHFR